MKARLKERIVPSKDKKFTPLLETLDSYFELDLDALPAAMAAIVKKEYDLFPWDMANAEQRRSLAAQKDFQNDPALEPMRQWYWDKAIREDELQQEIQRVRRAGTPTVSDLAKQKEMIAALEEELRDLHRKEYPGTVDSSGSGAPGVIEAAPVRQKAQQMQEERILAYIKSLGHDPKSLPSHPPGKPGVKAAVRQMALKDKHLFQSVEVFKKAWDRLRDKREILGG